MNSQFAVGLMVMEAKAKPSVRKLVEERVHLGLCLIPGCDCEIIKRGLCEYHYGQFYNEWKVKPPAERLTYEQAQIKEGRLLPSREWRKKKVVNPFRG